MMDNMKRTPATAVANTAAPDEPPTEVALQRDREGGEDADDSIAELADLIEASRPTKARMERVNGRLVFRRD